MKNHAPKNHTAKNSGFTLVELLISVSIFVFMTTFLVSKYGTFNQSVMVTNAAYDVALTIRSAQSYGLNVRGTEVDLSGGGTSQVFNRQYGVHFTSGTTETVCPSITANNSSFYLFSEPKDPPITCEFIEEVSRSTLKKNIYISKICIGNTEAECDVSSGVDSVEVSFKRPDPNAIIFGKIGSDYYKSPLAKITLKAPDGNQKSIIILSTGQISITD